jgi:Ca-activated chloride channel family protein
MLGKGKRIRFTLAGVLILGVAAGTAAAARAQEGVTGAPPVYSPPKEKDPELTRRQEPDIRVQSTLVTTPVTVLDESGEYIYDLREQDFEILDNGFPQHIARFENLGRPIAAVIIVQTNERTRPVLGQVRPLAAVFSMLMLGPKGQAAVVSYDDRVRQEQDFSDSDDVLEKTLEGLKVQGGKARLNDALMRAIALLEKRPRTERRIIVAISDGFDSGSETGNDEVVRRATGSEITIYGLGFNPAQLLLAAKPRTPPPDPLNTNVTRPTPPGTVPTPSSSQGTYDAPIPIVDILVGAGRIINSAVTSSTLEFYAGYTGGAFFGHWKKKTLEDQLSRMAAEINSQYELAYVPATLNQPGFHRIEVQVRRPGLKVRARAGYFYQPPQPQKTAQTP